MPRAALEKPTVQAGEQTRSMRLSVAALVSWPAQQPQGETQRVEGIVLSDLTACGARLSAAPSRCSTWNRVLARRGYWSKPASGGGRPSACQVRLPAPQLCGPRTCDPGEAPTTSLVTAPLSGGTGVLSKTAKVLTSSATHEGQVHGYPLLGDATGLWDCRNHPVAHSVRHHSRSPPGARADRHSHHRAVLAGEINGAQLSSGSRSDFRQDFSRPRPRDPNGRLVVAGTNACVCVPRGTALRRSKA